ncbi:MAG: hypothetical protein M0P66_16375, partial [Salinivirgaceae bacterium]|nr:hypothetical protein [Salinivirgaceae bacterium]
MKIRNSSGLAFDFLENGSIQQIVADSIRISLKPATEFSKSGANLFLRKKTQPIQYKPLLGPESNSVFQYSADAFTAHGNWDGLEYTCTLQLSAKSLSWQWQIEVKNSTDAKVELDVIYMQDIGLKPATSGLVNEYYVSQY